MDFRKIFQESYKAKCSGIVLCLYFICSTFYIYLSYQLVAGDRLHVSLKKTDSLRNKNKPRNFSSDNMLYGHKRCFQMLRTVSKNRIQLADLVSRQCKRLVTIDRAIGRMGNNMFQISALFGLAYRYDLIPVVPLTIPLLEYFDLPNVVNIKKRDIRNIINCPIRHVAIYSNFSKDFDSQSNFTIRGFFQSWRYFDEEEDVIRNVLLLRANHINNAKEYIKKVNPNRRIQVCIHVRRGDFLSDRLNKEGFSVADKGFIERAKLVFVQNYSEVLFLVVTNDEEWCKDNLKNVTVSPFINPGDDMALMALSDHVIITSGSFGWWGAWLSRGQVLYFNGYPRHKSRLDSIFRRYDYYPPSWKGLE